MQNSFWFLGVVGRFQEIKQYGLEIPPKTGAFWPHSRSEQPLPEVEHFLFSQRIETLGTRGGLGLESGLRADLWGAHGGVRFPAGSLRVGAGGSWEAALICAPPSPAWPKLEGSLVTYRVILTSWLGMSALEDLYTLCILNFPKDWMQWQWETCSVLWPTVGFTLID